jgi:hypothetical protein
VVAAEAVASVGTSESALAIRSRKRGSMSKMKFSNYQAKQSRVVEGVCVPISHGLVIMTSYFGRRSASRFGWT